MKTQKQLTTSALLKHPKTTQIKICPWIFEIWIVQKSGGILGGLKINFRDILGDFRGFRDPVATLALHKNQQNCNWKYCLAPLLSLRINHKDTFFHNYVDPSGIYLCSAICRAILKSIYWLGIPNSDPKLSKA